MVRAAPFKKDMPGSSDTALRATGRAHKGTTPKGCGRRAHRFRARRLDGGLAYEVGWAKAGLLRATAGRTQALWRAMAHKLRTRALCAGPAFSAAACRLLQHGPCPRLPCPLHRRHSRPCLPGQVADDHGLEGVEQFQALLQVFVHEGVGGPIFGDVPARIEAQSLVRMSCPNCPLQVAGQRSRQPPHPNGRLSTPAPLLERRPST